MIDYGGYKTKTRKFYEKRQRYPIFGMLSEDRTTRTAKVVTVLSCPKDNPNDLEPMFSRGAKFTFDNFLVSLEAGVWPAGMEFELRVSEIYFDDTTRRAYRYEFVREYVIPSGRRYNKSYGQMTERRRLYNRIYGDTSKFHQDCIEDFKRKKNGK